ncbi:MAG: hypothetical protein ACO1SX_08545, partial [Actinomycetota bacterium]
MIPPITTERSTLIVETNGNVDATPREPRYWKISPGRNASEWEAFLKHQAIAFGEDERVPDIRALAPVSRQALEQFFEEHALAGSDRSPKYAARRMWQFFHEMQPGDRVCAYGKRKILGIGVIQGDYL